MLRAPPSSLSLLCFLLTDTISYSSPAGIDSAAGFKHEGFMEAAPSVLASPCVKGHQVTWGLQSATQTLKGCAFALLRLDPNYFLLILLLFK